MTVPPKFKDIEVKFDGEILSDTQKANELLAIRILELQRQIKLEMSNREYNDDEYWDGYRTKEGDLIGKEMENKYIDYNGDLTTLIECPHTRDDTADLTTKATMGARVGNYKKFHVKKLGLFADRVAAPQCCGSLIKLNSEKLCIGKQCDGEKAMVQCTGFESEKPHYYCYGCSGF